ncbi:MAG: small basic family protein [Eubacteriales bacterium]|jgi:small basic protein|nr:small basic family protein [Eubacteriales bacterium]MDD3196926.1 small basic family protein [Eubacteriales bacterium]MDD4681744.1 small basic family protein [Eubacteriales bacterium]
MFPLIGLIIGLIIGLLWNIDIPPAFSSYFAVGILAAIDSVVGALTANLKNQYNTRLFVSGFIGNSAIAVLLAALGDQLDLQLSLAAVFAFGNRIFINFSTIRRLLLDKTTNRKKMSVIDSKNTDNDGSIKSD